MFVEDVACALLRLCLKSPVTGPVNIMRQACPSLSEPWCPRWRRFSTRPSLSASARVRSPPVILDVLVADVGRLTHEVGWQPAVTLAQGLEVTIRWHRERSLATPRQSHT